MSAKAWFLVLLAFLIFGWSTGAAALDLPPEPLNSPLVEGDVYAREAVNYWQQKYPGQLLTVLDKQTLLETEQGYAYTILKGELNNQEALYLTVRHNDLLIQEGRELPQTDLVQYINAYHPVYQKMSQPLRRVVREAYGGALPVEPSLSVGNSLDVILIVRPQVDIQALAGLIARWDAGYYIYDGQEAYEQARWESPDLEERPDSPLRLIAAKLDLAQISNVILDERIAQAWHDPRAEVSLNLSVPHVQGDDVRALGYEGANTDVAIIDTGVDASHPDLDWVIAQQDFTGDDTSDDQNGHGTHVAGIVGSSNVTNRGMAPLVDLISAKVLDGPNGGVSVILSGIDWAITRGADIIQMSINTYDDSLDTDASAEFSRYIDYVVFQLGKTYVVSTGNYKNPGNTSTSVLIPADAYNSISVGATNATFDALANYSGHGLTSDGRCKVDVLAPGTDITSTAFNWEGTNADFIDKSGTSMAAPHVSGLAALLWDYGEQEFRNQQPKFFKAAILNSANKLAGWTHTSTQPLDPDQGSGQIDALEAYKTYKNSSRTLPGSVSGTSSIHEIYYLVNITSTVKALNATLVWERKVSDYTQITQPVLNDLDLRLYNATVSSQVSSSTSSIDNVEHISYTAGTAGYFWLKVDPFDLPSGGVDIYALATNFDMTYYGNIPLTAFSKSSPSNATTNWPLSPDLTWGSSIGASSYEYCIDTTNDNACAGENWINVGANTTVHLSNLTPLTTYYWQVRARNTIATLLANDGIWHRFTTTLATASGVNASDGTSTTKVTVTWSSITGATYYKVYRATDAPTNSKTELGTPSATTYDDTSQTPERIYYYFVRACNSSGCGDYSASNSGYREMPIPTDVSASDGSYASKVRITWGSVSGATYYKVYRGTAIGGQTFLVDSSNAYYEDTTATPGRTYYYYIAAYNSYGNGAQSAYNSGWRMMPVPENLSASDGSYSDKVRLSWNTVSGATYYEIYRSTTSGTTGSLLSSPSTSPFDDTSASFQLLYYYSIRACNSYTCSSSSAQNEGWRTYAAPSGLSASDGTYTDKVRLTWNSLSGAEYYQVFRGDSATNQTYIGFTNSTTYDDTSALTPERPYYYDVQACNSHGCGLRSSDNTGYKEMLAPGSLTASDGTHPGFVRVTWSSVTGATFYKIYRGAAPGGQTYLGQIAATTYDDASALPYTTYYYYSQACNSFGCGAQSSSYNDGYAATGIAQGVSASDGAYTDKVRITWNSVGGASNYYVYRRFPGHSDYLLGVTSELYFDDYLSYVMMVYDYYIVVNGSGDPSAADSGWRTLPPPANLQASDNSLAQVNITSEWPQGTETMRVFRAPSSSGPWEEIVCSAGGFFFCYDKPTPDQTFYYKVQACILDPYANYEPLCGGFSNIDSGWRRNSMTSATASDGTSTEYVQITWNAVEGAEKYLVLYSEWPDEPGSWGSASDYLVGQLSFNHIPTPGILYYYAVIACEDTDYGTECAERGPYDAGWRGVPPPPNVQASDGALLDGVKITWDSVGHAYWVHYEVYRADEPDGTKQYLGKGSGVTLTFTDTLALQGVPYTYWVKACSYQERCGELSLPDSGYKPYPLYLPLLLKPAMAISQHAPGELTLALMLGLALIGRWLYPLERGKI